MTQDDIDFEREELEKARGRVEGTLRKFGIPPKRRPRLTAEELRFQLDALASGAGSSQTQPRTPAPLFATATRPNPARQGRERQAARVDALLKALGIAARR